MKEITPLNSILTKDSKYNRVELKRRLIKDGLLAEVCSKCPTGAIWNGARLVLQLDHINGVYNDNRLENLRLLCPNCHSQTENFAGRNVKRRIIERFCSCGKKIHRTSKCCHACHLSNLHRLNINSRKRKVQLRPSSEILTEQVKRFGYRATGRMYGVSDNAIRKWLKT